MSTVTVPRTGWPSMVTRRLRVIWYGFNTKVYGTKNKKDFFFQANKGARLDLHSDNGQGPRPIHWASRNGHVAVVDVLLSVSQVTKIHTLTLNTSHLSMTLSLL